MIKCKTSATFIGSKELTDVEVVYSKPLAKGRVIFGGLVPFGNIWRTGADGNTMISFSRDILIAGTVLKQGKHALYSVPGPHKWDIIFYRNYSSYGLPRPWLESDVVLICSAECRLQNQYTEAMTINVNPLSQSAGQLEILWEETSVILNFEIPAQIENQADILLLGGIPETDYYCAAEFYGTEGNDLERALWSINAVIQHNGSLPYFYYWQKALLEAKTGDFDYAAETAEIALDAALKAKNERYSEMIRNAIIEWKTP